MIRLAAGLVAVVLLQAGNTSLLLNPDDPEWSRQAPERFRVDLETNKGGIGIDVQREWAPHGADRFYNLVRHGYYDGARFFRVISGQWAQFGINGNPAVSRIWRTRSLPDEPRMMSNVRGTIAYAFKDPNGRTTQVFINLRDNSATHDAEPFVPFGLIVEGMDVADRLNGEYGEQSGGGIRRGRQDPLFEGGNEYLRREFPRLDYIYRARVVAAHGTPEAEPVNTLLSSRADLERFFSSLVAVKSHETVEALPVTLVGEGLSSIHRVEERPIRLSADTGRALAKVLLSVDSYDAAMSARLFEPAVALRFHGRGTCIQALVCFRCSELVFEDAAGKALSGRMKFGRARATLLSTAKKAFPANREIQALKE
jgi:cyclophilin family peptidyl-prolyl cis-trans isomerase